jgi:hypothetical protein
MMINYIAKICIKGVKRRSKHNRGKGIEENIG